MRCNKYNIIYIYKLHIKLYYSSLLDINYYTVVYTVFVIDVIILIGIGISYKSGAFFRAEGTLQIMHVV